MSGRGFEDLVAERDRLLQEQARLRKGTIDDSVEHRASIEYFVEQWNDTVDEFYILLNKCGFRASGASERFEKALGMVAVQDVMTKLQSLKRRSNFGRIVAFLAGYLAESDTVVRDPKMALFVRSLLVYLGSIKGIFVALEAVWDGDNHPDHDDVHIPMCVRLLDLVVKEVKRAQYGVAKLEKGGHAVNTLLANAYVEFTASNPTKPGARMKKPKNPSSALSDDSLGQDGLYSDAVRRFGLSMDAEVEKSDTVHLWHAVSLLADRVEATHVALEKYAGQSGWRKV